MIEEIFQLEVAPGTEKDFEADFPKVVQLLETSDGYRGSELKRSIENDNVFLISVVWKNLEAHNVDFKNSSAYEEMKQILAPHYLEVPKFQHFYKVF